ncbi:MAG: hypothetical protein P8P74_08325 [Crocinitomicaceae bacterium]|nr:hypothetical protein [Crocinitomicaceae bacterium]
MSSTKPNMRIKWTHVLLVFLIGVALPALFIYLAAQGIDSGYFGGKPGYVSGDGVLIWLVERLHVVIITGFFGFFAFLIILVLKVHQLFWDK